MNDVIVRTALASDLESLLSLYIQLSPANAATQPLVAAPTLDHILRSENVSLLVADAGDALLGTVTLVIVPNLTHNALPWAQVENMVVDGRARARGVGRLLMEECLRLASVAGCYKVQLQSGNERSEPPNDAHGFYRHLGFQPSSVGFRRYLT